MQPRLPVTQRKTVSLLKPEYLRADGFLLTSTNSRVYADSIAAKSAIGISLSERNRAQRRSHEALFLCPAFMAGVTGASSDAPVPSVPGKANPVASATLLISLNGGSFQLKTEGTTMTTLIPIASRTIAGNPTETVSAKRLHEFLGIGRDFTSWIKGRIEQYGFEEKIDYVVTLTKTGERKNVTKSNYFVTLDMAKEICMVERNDKGREARRYFIECEKQLRSQKQIALTHREPELPPALQKVLDERVAMLSMRAHEAIKNKLTSYAHDATTRHGLDPVDLFRKWSSGASTRLLMRSEISVLQNMSEFLSGELTKFSKSLDKAMEVKQ